MFSRRDLMSKKKYGSDLIIDVIKPV